MAPASSSGDSSSQPSTNANSRTRVSLKTLLAPARKSSNYGGGESETISNPLGGRRSNTPPTPFERFLQLVRRRSAEGFQPPPLSLDSPVAGLPQQETSDSYGALHARAESCPSTNPFATDDPREHRDESSDGVTEGVHQHGTDATSEPTTIARRLQKLISSLPPFMSNATPTAAPLSPLENPSSPAQMNSGLISLLSSASLMNGSSSIGQRSVWSLLDGMRSGSRLSHEAADSENDEDDLLTEYTDDDRSSLMLYGPLVPTTDSEVEIATSEVISISTEDEIRDVAVNNSHPAVVEENTPPMIRPFSRPWPFAARTNRPTQRPSTEAVVERRLWVPSSNKISLQLLWWGYRVYLPPPVLDILNNQRIEATKRAAIITTALKWLLDHIPASAVPLQLRPALELARALVPYLVYVGGFIAWSWTTIKGFDKGHGVVLSATWLLPIALIPGTWEESTGPRPDASASTKRSEG